MNHRIRLLIALTILLAIGTIVVLTKMPPSTWLPTLLRQETKAVALPLPAHYGDIEELLKKGRYDEARLLTLKCKQEAKDSTEYYQYVVQDAKLQFAKMNADSFMLVNRQLAAYMERNARSKDLRLKQLAVEVEMQRGVYEVKMVGNMDAGLAHYEKAMQKASELPNYEDRMLLLINLADVYKQMGRYDQSVRYFMKAMDLGDSIGMDDATVITLNIGIASAYAAMDNFEQSDEWWEKARQMRPQMSQCELFQYLNNRGNSYYLQGKYDESLNYFLELDSMMNLHEDMHWEKMYGRANLSDIYIKLGHPEKALPLLNEAEPFFLKENQHIAYYYLTTQRIELALNTGHIAEAEQLAMQSGMPERMIPEQKMLRLKVLLRLYQLQGHWQEYAKALQEMDHIVDSVKSDNTKMQLSEIIMRYDYEQKMLNKQRLLEEANLSFRWAVALLIAAVIVITLLIAINVLKLHQRRLKEQNMQAHIASLRMEAVRNRITPHFMSNALTAEMIAQMDGHEPNLDSLVQLLHRGIEMSGTELTTLSEELEFVEFYCSVESRAIGPDFVFRKELGPGVDPDKVKLPAMFLQIMVENALKHGLWLKPRQEGRERMVLVRAIRSKAGTQVDVIDNGVGMQNGLRNQKRIGLSVVEETILLLNAQNHEKMQFGYGNYQHPNGDTGYRSTFYLPDNYNYVLKK